MTGQADLRSGQRDKKQGLQGAAYADVLSCFSVLPTHHLFSGPHTVHFYIFSISNSLSFFLCFLCICSYFTFSFPLSLSVSYSVPCSLQKSVVQQLDSSGWRKPGCVRGSEHSPSGPQLHQPHHRGSLQRPQGCTHLVSTPQRTPPSGTLTTITKPPIISGN